MSSRPPMARLGVRADANDDGGADDGDDANDDDGFEHGGCWLASRT